MLSLQQLISDVDGSVGRGSGEDRARTLGRITDLFLVGSDAFTPDQVELFDMVIQRFAVAIETRARVELAVKLAHLAKAPPGIVIALANDEIVVARSVLANSPQLDDQTLMAIALEKGCDHMLAICERAALSTAVTDVLVEKGDGVVRHAVAGNRGARFSPAGAAVLVGHARQDAALRAVLCERDDLPAEAASRLLAMARETVRARLLQALPGAGREVEGAVERGALDLARATARMAAAESTPAVLRRVLDGPAFTEADLAAFAEEDRRADVLEAMVSMTGLSKACLEPIFEERDNDLLIVIGKARGWAWSTVRSLLRLRDPNLTQRHQFRRCEETFDGLAPATASRVVHFLKVRDTTAILTRGPKPDRLRSA